MSYVTSSIEAGTSAHSEQLHRFDGQVSVPGARVPVEYSLVTPETITHDSLALIVPGFGAIKPTSEKLQAEVARQAGMAVIAYDPLREHAEAKNNRRSLANPQELHYQTISRILEDVAVSRGVRQLPNGAAIADQGATLMPHSMGGLPAAEFAAENSAVIDRIVYLGCVGMEQPIGARILARGVKEIGVDIIPKIIGGTFGYRPSMATRSAKYFLSNPLRTAAEIYSCAVADSRPAVYKLARLGVAQSVICFENDAFFHPYDTEEGVGYVIGFDNIITMRNADHVAPQSEPRRTAEHIVSLLRTSNSLTTIAAA